MKWRNVHPHFSSVEPICYVKRYSLFLLGGSISESKRASEMSGRGQAHRVTATVIASPWSLTGPFIGVGDATQISLPLLQGGGGGGGGAPGGGGVGRAPF